MKIRFLFGAVLIASLFSAPVFAQLNIDGTSHDLAGGTFALTNGTTGDNGEICVYCHTPHNASTATGVSALWNRGIVASSTYTMYSSSTMNATASNTNLTAASLACLSCHDGTLAIDAVLNYPGLGDGTDGTAKMTGVGLVGQELGNDHPIGMSWTAATADPDIADTTLPLYGAGSDFVECATCHSVHDDANGSFLRIANANSNLCADCHDK